MCSRLWMTRLLRRHRNIADRKKWRTITVVMRYGRRQTSIFCWQEISMPALKSWITARDRTQYLQRNHRQFLTFWHTHKHYMEHFKLTAPTVTMLIYISTNHKPRINRPTIPSDMIGCRNTLHDRICVPMRQRLLSVACSVRRRMLLSGSV